MNNTSVDSFLQHGCGRCGKYQTPGCRVHRWQDPLVALRALARDAGLTEEMKWGHPCYTVHGHNVLMLGALTGAATLSFFRGVELDDPAGLLRAPGPSSRYARLIRFGSLDDVARARGPLKGLIQAAISLELSGATRPVAAADEPIPDALEARLRADPELQRAFDALTPGRRRSHILYVGAAKQEVARARRVDRCAPKIFEGLGFLERKPGAAPAAR